jgi:hypothetical protein
VAAPKKADAGIQVVAERLKVRPDGKPRLLVFRTALVGRDPLLAEANKPIGLVEEMDGYVWKDGRARDEPRKADDHAQDAARYVCASRERLRAVIGLPGGGLA